MIDTHLRCQYRAEHQAGLLLILNDICVVVHPKDAWCSDHWKRFDILEKFLVFIDIGYVINTTLVELIFLHLDNLHAIVSIEDRVQRSPVPFVRHSTAIITLACAREIDRSRAYFESSSQVKIKILSIN